MKPPNKERILAFSINLKLEGKSWQYQRVRFPYFQSSTVYRGVLISGCWNRGVLLYAEVSSFQGVGVSLYTEVSSFQGVGIEEFHSIQRCPHFRVLEFHCTQRCPHFRVLE